MGVLALLSALLMPGSTSAYSASGAASWADAHWNSCGVAQQYQCFSDDCTAFVSEALHSGGAFPFDTNGGLIRGDTSDDSQWYESYSSAHNLYWFSYSFVRTKDLRTYQIVDIPGGIDYGTHAGTSLAADSGGSTGDILFYDWGQGEGYSHSSLIVGYGNTNDGWYGDFVDAHTNNHLHWFWTLRTNNQFIQTTTIDVMHVLSTN
jgi:hypothetical protein